MEQTNQEATAINNKAALSSSNKKVHKAIIVRCGLSGLGMAILLTQAGYDDFIILEKANDLGGTWRENTYTGAACDVPSTLYSYSFDRNNPGWKEAYIKQADLLEYQRFLALSVVWHSGQDCVRLACGECHV
jgi:cation diffusion facilitator CzcD-associated flavoprotein CzcO